MIEVYSVDSMHGFLDPNSVDLDEFGLSMSNSLLINRPLGRVRKTATTHSATNEAGDTEQNQPQLQEPTHFRTRT